MCQLSLFFCLSIPLLKFDRHKNECHFRNIKWFTDSTVFTKKCLMLQLNAVMKVANEKKDIFSFYSHNMNKEFH